MARDSDDEDDLLEQALADMDRKQPPPRSGGGGFAGRGQPPLQPSSFRPPPAVPSPMPPARTAQQKIASRDEDDLSEVEMLSISSEDDEPVRPAPQAVSKAAYDDLSEVDEYDDDDEPHVWRAVDEKELVRRVREMRETRAAPAAGPMRMKRSSTIYESPSDLVDPLGQGSINLKTMSLIKNDTASPLSTVSSSQKKTNVMQNLGRRGKGSDVSSQGDLPQSPTSADSPVRDPATREKLLYFSEKFDPKFYLARIHRETAAVDLEAGDMALRRDLQSRREQLKKLVKENFDCFISCKNTIDDIHLRLQQIEMDREGAGTIQLSNNIADVDEVAKRAFGPLLERQAQAERIRSVQGLLSRFRTLFNLPSNIRMHIRKGEHDLVVREFRKAKSLIVPSQVGILRKVFEEVEKLVQDFREMLYRNMENPTIEVGEVENIVRLLLDLEPDSDPVWHYLTIQDRKIRAMLDACSHEHEVRMDALLTRVRERVQSEARWKQLQQESSKGSDVDLSLLLGEQGLLSSEATASDAAGEEVDALLGRLIRRLTFVVVRHIPAFWQLSISIFTKKFGRAAPPDGSMALEQGGQKKPAQNQRYGQYRVEEEIGDPSKFLTKHTQEEVTLMILNIISLYEGKVQSAFGALAEATVLRPNMREAIAEVASAIDSLKARDCAPQSAVSALMVLRADITRVFVHRLCSLMGATTTELAEEENWIPVPTSSRSGTPYTITAYPLRFADMMNQSLDYLKDGLEKLTKDEGATRDEGLLAIIEELQNAVRNTFFECFLDFVESLQKLAPDSNSLRAPGTGVGNSTDSENLNNPSSRRLSTSDGAFQCLRVGVRVENPHQRLLILLSNCGYARDHLFPTLHAKFSHLWPPIGPSEKDGRQEVADALAMLEEQLLNLYLDAKAALLGPAVADYLLEDGTSWSAAPPVKGLRDVALELMHPLVVVHAEVYAGARPWVERTISVLAEGLMHALQSVCTERVKSIDVNGCCQLWLELDYFETVLAAFSTVAMDETVAILREHLLDKASMGEAKEMPSRRTSRSSASDFVSLDDGPAMGVPASTPEDMQALANAVSEELLAGELKRTRINTICFTPPSAEPQERHLPLPEPRAAERPSSPPNMQRSRSAGVAQQQPGPYSRERGVDEGLIQQQLRRQSLSHASSESSEEPRQRLPPKGPGSVSSRYSEASVELSRGGPAADRYREVQRQASGSSNTSSQGNRGGWGSQSRRSSQGNYNEDLL